jgi:hypothetical protein
MKQLIKLSIISNLLVSTSLFALDNPVEGFYTGILAGISHGPASNQVAFSEPFQGSTMNFVGKVTYSSVGGGGGAVLGYKLSHFRLEGELFYNRISTGPLKVGSCTLEHPSILSPTGDCPRGTYDDFRVKGEAYSGSSAAVYGMVNFYYDFFTPNSSTNTVPYVGLGVGRAQVRNFSNFIYTNLRGASHGSNITTTATALQGILGVSYFMDDFTWIGMDLRYSTTKNLPQIQDAVVASKQYALTSLNFNVNFAFDKGAINFG